MAALRTRLSNRTGRAAAAQKIANNGNIAAIDDEGPMQPNEIPIVPQVRAYDTKHDLAALSLWSMRLSVNATHC